MTVFTLPPLPEAKFYISEHEPLVWLISIVFTDKFWDKKSLTQSSLFGFSRDNLEMKPPLYGSVHELYQAIEEWVKNDVDASVCLNKTLQAIQSGELSYYVPEADKWGDRPFYEPNRDVHSYTLLIWLQNNGYEFSEDVVNAARLIINTERNRIAEMEKEAYSYPSITADDLTKLKREPLWKLEIGILYLMGRRSRRDGKEGEYKGSNNLLGTLIDYALDAHKAGKLKIISEMDENEKAVLKVIPDELISWVKTLPFSLPMLDASPVLYEKPEHCTPDMALMYDAIRQFWDNYDLNNPDPNAAPMKKNVVAWLMEEAEKRKITNFSKTRAEHMDTIIRCPQSRKGGNSL